LNRFKNKGLEAAVSPRGGQHSIETVNQVIQMHRHGIRPTAIGKLLKLKTSSISNMISTLNQRGEDCLLETRQKFHSVEIKNQVITLFKLGRPRSEISEITKVPLVSIHNLIRKFEIHGVEVATSSNRISPEILNTIASYRARRETFKTIGAKLGFTERQIKGLVYKYKLADPKRASDESTLVINDKQSCSNNNRSDIDDIELAAMILTGTQLKKH
jgi:transposase-like protein